MSNKGNTKGVENTDNARNQRLVMVCSVALNAVLAITLVVVLILLLPGQGEPENTYSDDEIIDIINEMYGQSGQSADTPTYNFDYSAGIDENGFWEGVRALDCVELFDYTQITIPRDVHEVPDGVISEQIDQILAQYDPDVTEDNVTDEFVRENLSFEYGWQTFGEMEAEIRESYPKMSVQYFVMDTILRELTVTDIPDVLAGYLVNSLLAEHQRQASMERMSLDLYMQNFLGVESTDQFIENNSENLYRLAASMLGVQAIAEDAGITVGDDDIERYFPEHASLAGNLGMPYIKQNVLAQKVVDFLIEEYAVFE